MLGIGWTVGESPAPHVRTRVESAWLVRGCALIRAIKTVPTSTSSRPQMSTLPKLTSRHNNLITFVGSVARKRSWNLVTHIEEGIDVGGPQWNIPPKMLFCTNMPFRWPVFFSGHWKRLTKTYPTGILWWVWDVWQLARDVRYSADSKTSLEWKLK
jgi:hypothetical protein